MPLNDSSVKSGTGNEREKRWGVDRRNYIGPDSNLWASSPNVVGATAYATVPPPHWSLLTKSHYGDTGLETDRHWCKGKRHRKTMK